MSRQASDEHGMLALQPARAAVWSPQLPCKLPLTALHLQRQCIVAAHKAHVPTHHPARTCTMGLDCPVSLLW
jgi:hypothetical protein